MESTFTQQVEVSAIKSWSKKATHGQEHLVASDSHTNMYGGVGCLGTPIVRTDAASIWATGKT